MFRSKIVIGALLGLILVYVFLMQASCRGYGYPGYGGYHHSGSFWYWGGVRTHHNRSLRAGSRGGTSVRGGGPHGGK